MIEMIFSLLNQGEIHLFKFEKRFIIPSKKILKSYIAQIKKQKLAPMKFKSTYVIIAVVLFGCTKEIDSLPSNAINSSNVQNATVTNTYLPLTTGTYWNYNINTNGKTATSKLTVLGTTKKINNKTYHFVKSVDGGYTNTVYYNQSTHDYYVYTNSDEATLEILFLKDNAAKGATWTTSAGKASGFSVKCYGSIKATNLTMTINGKTYKNVIQSHIDLKATFFFFPITVYSQDYYVAKNIGIIKNVSTQLQPSKSTTTTNISGYSIK